MVVTRVVPRIKGPLSQEPCLYTKRTRGSGKARDGDEVVGAVLGVEAERRRVERGYLMELSMYYEPPPDAWFCDQWTNHALILRGEHDVTTQYTSIVPLTRCSSVLRDIQRYDPKAFGPEPPDDPIP